MSAKLHSVIVKTWHNLVRKYIPQKTQKYWNEMNLKSAIYINTPYILFIWIHLVPELHFEAEISIGWNHLPYA